MPKKILRSFLPTVKQIHENRFLKKFGKLLHDGNLWHLNKHSVSGATAVGLFCAFIPVPFQMVIAAAGSIFLRVNLPMSVALCWITNPLTMPVIFYGCYKLGAFLLNTPELPFDLESLGNVWQPFLLGCTVCCVVFAIVGYFAMRLLWLWSVRSRWKKRSLQRQIQNQSID